MSYEPTQSQLASTSYDDENKAICGSLKARYAAQKEEKINKELNRNKKVRIVLPITKNNLVLANISKEEIAKLVKKP